MVEHDFETYLSLGGVRIDERDIEMFRAINQCGSMHRAADELGRSYAHLQRRIEEIEGAGEPITERQRGGKSGGGTVLTNRGVELLRRFERLRGEFEGVASVTWSVFSGTIVEQTGEIASVQTDVGPVLAVVSENRENTSDGRGDERAREPGVKATVQVGVRSDAVVLTLPPEAPDPEQTSLRNQFEGTVESITEGEAIARVSISIAPEMELVALITTASLRRMALRQGTPVIASFKATAARVIEDGDSTGS